ncbi:hypothetical protein CAOG_01833 [Capsaspora owczarzaki ATCC 30864]|uniref:Uncharacterized protein n=1 Tax=Capsaspora owczarzaki (strain ATCC 30864) TaxID=595528 RepID=A0A0D2WL70_CAPO3|nr:hypothetical protein CAOG_01833 [Capsaspora owczarzaki ATCC 30864]KJE90525.1 hypothetical protein CAOG_001833 [Capsaspora owczarzaki ATCC 30864]KJE90528.1 hypothetical protein CAOG_009467 [Capsaspora owczarzaki ATCC 30864]|eukprot:XP_004364701.1 hypothetical protein CAOG_01833 [Capsaspora owczarzaki ATCC 30864]
MLCEPSRWSLSGQLRPSIEPISKLEKMTVSHTILRQLFISMEVTRLLEMLGFVVGVEQRMRSRIVSEHLKWQRCLKLLGFVSAFRASADGPAPQANVVSNNTLGTCLPPHRVHGRMEQRRCELD